MVEVGLGFAAVSMSDFGVGSDAASISIIGVVFAAVCMAVVAVVAAAVSLTVAAVPFVAVSVAGSGGATDAVSIAIVGGSTASGWIAVIGVATAAVSILGGGHRLPMMLRQIHMQSISEYDILISSDGCCVCLRCNDLWDWWVEAMLDGYPWYDDDLMMIIAKQSAIERHC